jgi:hypothetical protein
MSARQPYREPNDEKCNEPAVPAVISIETPQQQQRQLEEIPVEAAEADP